MGVGTRGVDTRAAASVFEIPIDLGQPADVVRAITGWAASANGTGGRKRVMYANAHVLNQSVEVPALRRILGEADLVYCDGYGVRVAARALGVEEPHRMTGADWVWGLASICEADGISLYLLGSEPGAAREAARRLRRWHPDLDVVGAHHGYFEADTPHNERVLEDINACRPNILLVGMGSPKQELWVDRYADRLDVDILWTVGALFDYVSGRVPRAPRWVADNGLEWIFRLGIEPQRMWRRYLLGNPVFLSRVVADTRRRRAMAPPA